MRGLIWTIFLVGLALWTIFAWGAAGLVGAAGDPAPGAIGKLLGLGSMATGWAGTLGIVGTGAIWIMWALGALLLLLGTMLLSRTVRALGRLAQGRSSARGRPPFLHHGRASFKPIGHLIGRAAPGVRRVLRR